MSKFEVGQVFESICYGDSDLAVRWTVIKRTAKTVTIKESFTGEEKTKRIKFDGRVGVETVTPEPGFTYLSADEPIQIELIEEITADFECDKLDQCTESLATISAPATVTLVNDEPLAVIDIDDCFVDAEWFNDSKNDRFSLYMKSEKTPQEAKIDRVVILTANDFTAYMMSLLDSKSFLDGKGGTGSRFENTAKYIWELSEQDRKQWFAQSFSVAVAVTDGQRLILINPEGYDYARYVGVCGTEGLLNYLADKHGIKFYQDTFLDQAIEF